jgi:hypothetical protein
MLLDSHTHIKKAFVLTENKYGSIPEQKLHFKPLVYTGSLDKF